MSRNGVWLLRNNQIYLDKIELGKQIADIMNEGVVREESLVKDQEEALHVYRNQKPTRIWEHQLLRATISNC